MGAANIMAIMEDKTLKHGPIDALITRDEETGMFGANELPEGELQGDILLNLDSEHWGKFVIGSAGGIVPHRQPVDYHEDTVRRGCRRHRDGEEPARRTLRL